MNIIRATHLGMCFGVRDAISLAFKRAATGSLTILGELVHNDRVNQMLKNHGVRIQEKPESVDTSTVMITAHGASDQKIARVRQEGREVLEATCPLVHFAHRMLKDLVAKGCHPVIIGKRDHVEVRGMTEDLKEFNVILNEEEIEKLEERPKFGVVAQTTQPIDRVRHLVGKLRERFPNSEIQFRDTVCQPTKQRQSAAVELSQKCDVIVVVGGNHSNNTRELAETCRQYCSSVVQVQDAEELKPFWFYNAQTVGITAGTSTPDEVIESVETKLREITQLKNNGSEIFLP